MDGSPVVAGAGRVGAFLRGQEFRGSDGMKASEVGECLRQRAGKRDHREVLSDDVVVIRPGPNFDWLMRSLPAGQPAPPSPEHGQSSEDRRKAGDRLGRTLLHGSERRTLGHAPRPPFPTG
jgi:hypothetical protein